MEKLERRLQKLKEKGDRLDVKVKARLATAFNYPMDGVKQFLV
jgi:hypothetical protein